LVPLIYIEIISYSEDNPPGVNVGYEFPRLPDENGKEYVITLMTLLIDGMKVAAGKENDMKELKERISNLLYKDSDLQSLVLKLNSLKNEFDTDKTRNAYFSEIDTLHKSIFQEALDIKGKCRLCHPSPG
jgi:hypothetical protein